MDLHGTDLNLLVAFDALMAERSVTRAGMRIGRTQPRDERRTVALAVVARG